LDKHELAGRIVFAELPGKELKKIGEEYGLK
jgi:hypothetical protein